MQEKMTPKLIIVLGMHRAGTSTVTRGLEVLGVSLGNRLLPPMEYVNPKGFFEDVEVLTLNDEMLSAIGSDWYRVSPIDASQLESLKQQGFIQRAADLIQKKCLDLPVFGLKDPRISKLLPFWNQVFDFLGYETGFVLALRNPLSVAKSLKKRDGLQKSHSFYLWLAYMLESLRSSQGHPRLVVDYDQLITSPQAQINRVADTFGLKVDALAMRTYTTDFLENELRHTTHTTGDLLTTPACPKLIKEVFDCLRQAASDQISLQDPAIKKACDAWWDELEQQRIPFELIDDQLGRIDQLKQDASLRESKIAQMSQEKLAQEATVTELEQTVADQQSRISHLQDQTATLDQQRLALQEALEQAKATERLLLNSRSWRLTYPLRYVRGMLDRRK